MSNKNYSWIKPGVHAWVAGLVCPVEVEIRYNYHDFKTAWCICGTLSSAVYKFDLYQTEAECLEVMRSKAPNLQN